MHDEWLVLEHFYCVACVLMLLIFLYYNSDEWCWWGYFILWNLLFCVTFSYWMSVIDLEELFSTIFQRWRLLFLFELDTIWKTIKWRSVQDFSIVSRCFSCVEETCVISDVSSCGYDIWALLNSPYYCIFMYILWWRFNQILLFLLRIMIRKLVWQLWGSYQI